MKDLLNIQMAVYWASMNVFHGESYPRSCHSNHVRWWTKLDSLDFTRTLIHCIWKAAEKILPNICVDSLVLNRRLPFCSLLERGREKKWKGERERERIFVFQFQYKLRPNSFFFFFCSFSVFLWKENWGSRVGGENIICLLVIRGEAHSTRPFILCSFILDFTSAAKRKKKKNNY